LPFKDRREYDRNRKQRESPEHREAFFNAKNRKRDIERILKRKLSWPEFKLYDSGDAVAPDFVIPET
jgi:hypothetical protein